MGSGKEAKICQFIVISLSLLATSLLIVFAGFEYNRQKSSLVVDNSQTSSVLLQEANETSTTEGTTMKMETDPKCAIIDWYGDGLCDGLNNEEACHFDGGDCNPKCLIPVLAGDGHCQEENNVEDCNYDEGDCLQESTTEFNWYWISTDESECISVWYGDGYCDLFNNVAVCDFDGGDCDQFNVEDQSHIECVDQSIGDGSCDAANYFEKCDLDGGDCSTFIPLY